MDDKIETTEVRQEITKQEKVLSLFKFIEELNKAKSGASSIRLPVVPPHQLPS